MTLEDAVPAVVRPRKRTVLDIIAYLREHPGACDSLKGIAEWWIRCTSEAAIRALDYLCAKGFLRCSQRNGQALYSRHPVFPEKRLQELISEVTVELD